MTTLHELSQNNHAPWLHYLRRSFIESGELSAMIEDGIRGITVDLGVIERAIAYSADYDRILTQLQTEGVPFDARPRALLVDDVQRAAYILNPVYEQSNRLDGYVSLPIDPALAHKTTETVAAVRHLLADINCPNVMVEIPATDAGIEAIEKLTLDGVCINATQIYNLATYERVAQAYMTGLADYIRTHSVWRQWPTSIATIAVGRLDKKMADLLAPYKRTDLIDKTGIALAQAVYGRYQEIFSGPQWQKMADKGAYPQRLLWTSLAPHDFRHEETFYSDALCVPDTVSDLSPSLLNTFRERRSIPRSFIQQTEQARGHMAALAALSIDMEAVAKQLQAEDLAHLAQQLETLRESVRQKRSQMEDNWRRLHWQFGEMETAVTDSLSHTCTDRVMCRIWRHDSTVWQSEPGETSNRMGWLHLMPAMRSQIDRLHTMTDGLLADGFTHAMLLGMGGSGLAPHLFTETFSQVALPPRPGLLPSPHLHLNVLANTDPTTILAQMERLDLRHTIFVVASKSGRTVETMAAFNFFYNRVAAVVGDEKAGDHFIAVTDAGSPLAQIAADYRFRHVFYNLTSLTSRYAALSYIGLVPAALAGVNLETLLARAEGMACNTHSCNCPLEGDNIAAQLGTALGVLAQAGRNKLTFITSPALAGFADWVEQLLAGSTGKAGVGIMPVVGESVGDPAVYGPDRAFLYLRLDGDDSQDTAVSTLQAAGFPVITVRWHDLSDLGGQFFLWQMAAAVAAYHLNVNPFSQPQADALKAQIGEIVTRIQAKEEPKLPKTAVILDTLPELHRFLAQAQPGTTLAIQAFVPQTKEMDALLSALRTQLRDQYQLATLVGYGPRCLHTIGQMLKGGPKNIYVVLLVATAKQDVPIPDEAGQSEATLTFGKLQDIQAAVDGRALRRAYRHVLHFQLGADVENRLRQFIGEEVAFQIK